MEDFHQLWDKIISNLERLDIERVAIILRLIWLRRNAFVFQNILKHSYSLVQTTIFKHEEYQVAQQRNTCCGTPKKQWKDLKEGSTRFTCSECKLVLCAKKPKNWTLELWYETLVECS